MSARCTKAIIAVAGFGTRWLPLTKSIEKCMLPVGNRPIIDYVVEDCIKAGITDIYFVVSEQSDQLRRYYGKNELLYKYLEQRGKHKELKQLKDISAKARFHYVVQSASMPYGTAVPIMLCKQFVEPHEQVVVVMGDQFMWNPDGKSEIAHLINEVKATGVTAGMGAVHVPKKEVSKYGVIEIIQHHHKRLFKRIVEKPAAGHAPSNLINLSLYVFDNELFDCLPHIRPTNGEYYVTDALNIYVNRLQKQLAVVPAIGEYLDGGTVEGWLYANQRVFGSHRN